MQREINLLSSLPKPKRDIKSRSNEKNSKIVAEAKKFSESYFDGDRKYGYGGFRYDGRWIPVARDIIKFFRLKRGAKVLDIGCAKGFLVKDMMTEGKALDVQGLDVSKYALEHCVPGVEHRLVWGSADALPFADKSFNLVLSINTLHNLPRERLIKALREIERVSRGSSYIVVDSYHTPEQKALFESWVLTAETHGYPDEWEALFEEAGYTGFYSWTIID